MTNRITTLFKDKPENILSIFFTAGYPELYSTRQIIHYLQQAKVDLIEIGIPFSDPLADGLTLQKSSTIAIENGLSLTTLFDDLKEIRQSISIPIVLMGYLNPILQYGIENFLEKCSTLGVDGVIIPDLPLDYYNSHFKESMQKKQLSYIALISQQTPVERIKLIDQHACGFIYMVSSSGVTGSKIDLSANKDYYQIAKETCKNNPLLIGFGIQDKHSYNQACSYSQGAIIGTAFVKHLSKQPLSQSSINEFIESIRS